MKGAEVLNWIDALPEDLREIVLAQMKSIRIKSGDALYERFSAPKGLYRVESGDIRLFSLAPDGRELIYKVYGLHENFGDLAAIDGKPYTLTAEAMTDSEVLFLSRNQLIELRKQYPVIETILLNFITQIARTALMSIEVAAMFPLHARLASRLAFMATSAAPDGENMIELKVPQKDLSIMVGASRQAVNKVLAEFQSMGLLETQYGSLRITDIEGLRRQTHRFAPLNEHSD